MAENIKCPVCGKTDIPDYLNEDVKCPCCGSDLSIYRIIEKIPKEGHRFSIWKPMSAVACIAAAGLGIMLFTQKPTEPTVSAEELSLLIDSIVALNNRLAQNKAASELSSSGYKYVVLRGDSYWSISKKFYGTGTRAVEVAQQNGKTVETLLMVGDTLIIK